MQREKWKFKLIDREKEGKKWRYLSGRALDYQSCDQGFKSPIAQHQEAKEYIYIYASSFHCYRSFKENIEIVKRERKRKRDREKYEKKEREIQIDRQGE